MNVVQFLLKDYLLSIELSNVHVLTRTTLKLFSKLQEWFCYVFIGQYESENLRTCSSSGMLAY